MSSELDWAEDKQRFLADNAEQQRANQQGHAPSEGAIPAGASSGALAQEFAQLAKCLFDEDTIEGVLRQVLASAWATVPGADLASVTLSVPSGGYTTPVETDPVATRLDQVQYRSGEGPCVEATRTPGWGVVFSPDLRAEQQWEIFGPDAAAEGVHSVLATGLFPESEVPRLGSLNLYSYRAGGLNEASRTIALLLASHASIALAATQKITATELENSQLREALDSRDVIGQAKGILMQRQGVDADIAFDLLRRSSQDLNIKLAALAETVAARRGQL